MIEVHLPDGRVLRFPDGTPMEVVQAASRRVLAQGRSGDGGDSGAGGALDLSGLRGHDTDGLRREVPEPIAQFGPAAAEAARQHQEAVAAKRAELATIAEHGDIGNRPPHGPPPGALGDPADPLGPITSRFPALARHSDQLTVIAGTPTPGDDRKAEFYPPWERDNPQPGKATIEVLGASPTERDNVVAGDALHYLGAVDPRDGSEVDPAFRRLRAAFAQTRTPEQQEVDLAEYHASGDRRPFDQWFDESRLDQYLMGYLSPDDSDEWRGSYTPAQRALLEKMRGYLGDRRPARDLDLGHDDLTDVPAPGLLPPRGAQGITQRAFRDTILDRGFGPVIGAAEHGISDLRTGRSLGALLPEGTRQAVRENQQEAFDRMLTAHPEGGFGRAALLAAGDVGASIAGPQALLGPGAGALAGRAAGAAGAGPGLRIAASLAGGAAEGAGFAALDTEGLPAADRAKLTLLGAGLGLLGGARSAFERAPRPAPPGTGEALAAAHAMDRAMAEAAEGAGAAGPGAGAAVAALDAQYHGELSRLAAAGDVPAAGAADRLQGAVAPEAPRPVPPQPAPRDLAAADRALSARWTDFLASKGHTPDSYYELPRYQQELLDTGFELRGPVAPVAAETAPDAAWFRLPSEGRAGDSSAGGSRGPGEAPLRLKVWRYEGDRGPLDVRGGTWYSADRQAVERYGPKPYTSGEGGKYLVEKEIELSNPLVLDAPGAKPQEGLNDPTSASLQYLRQRHPAVFEAVDRALKVDRGDFRNPAQMKLLIDMGLPSDDAGLIASRGAWAVRDAVAARLARGEGYDGIVLRHGNVTGETVVLSDPGEPRPFEFTDSRFEAVLGRERGRELERLWDIHAHPENYSPEEVRLASPWRLDLMRVLTPEEKQFLFRGEPVPRPTAGMAYRRFDPTEDVLPKLPGRGEQAGGSPGARLFSELPPEGREGSSAGPRPPVVSRPSEAGFIRIGRSGPRPPAPPAPPPPPAHPAESVMPRDEPTPPPAGPLGRLQSIADRVTDQLFSSQDAPVRRLRRAGLGKEAQYLEDMQARARGAGGMVDPQRRAGPVYEGTYVFDPDLYGPGQYGSRRTGDGLEAVLGKMDGDTLYDLDAYMAARRHLSLADRQQRAQLEYDWNRAQRLEQMRQARRADKESLRSVAGDVRGKQAAALQAARQEARSAGEYRAFLTSEGRLRRASGLRRDVGPGERSTDLAAGRLGRALAPAEQARTDALGAIRSAQRVALGIRDDATRRAPVVPRPPDLDLEIDPKGTATATQVLGDLQARYGPDGIARFDDLHARFRDWTVRAWLIPLKEAGRFSDAEFRWAMDPDGKVTYGGSIIDKNDLYAPYERLMEVLGDEPDVYGLTPTRSTAANPAHRITGGLSPGQPIARPIQSAVEMAQKATLWVERQRARNILGAAVDSSPELQTEIRRLTQAGGAGTGPATGLPIQVRSSFPVWRDGVRADYTAPPDVLRAVETMTPRQLGPVLEVAKLAARTLRAGATITLEFPFRNLGRDVTDAAVYGPGYHPVLKVTDAFAGLLDIVGQKRWANEWRANGGALAGAVSAERPQVQASVRDVTGQRGRLLRRYETAIGGTFGERIKAAPVMTSLKSVMFPLLAPMEALAEDLESATKVGVYRRLRLRGESPGRAAVISRDASSPDFGRHGSFGQVWNQVEAFSNAELQDLYRFGRALRRDPAGTTIKAMAFITLPSIANWVKNSDDPDYQALPEWERVSFYHPVKLEHGRWVRIPRPLGILNLAFSYGPQKLLELAKDQDPDAAAAIGRAFVDQTPLHYLPQPENLRGGGSLDWLPTIAQPLAEVAAGPAGHSSFARGPVDPTALYPDSAPLPEDRVNDNTSGVARGVGKALGVSPIKVDYLIRGYGAFWGRSLAQATGPLARALGADPADDGVFGRMAQGGTPQLPLQPSDLPGLHGFVSSPAIGFTSDPVTKLYALAMVSAQAERSRKEAAESGNPMQYVGVLGNHPEIHLYRALQDDRKFLSTLRERRREALTQPGLDPETRQDLVWSIDQLVSTYAGSRMHAYADFIRNQQQDPQEVN